MPHFGQLKALTGTLRSDGVVSRVSNSLTTTPISTTQILLEDGTDLLLEDGTQLLLE